VERQQVEGVTKQQVAEMLGRGFTPRQIARNLDISTQRVYQHMETLRKEALAENESA
jgi:DNA-binding CsgD family transcriptional regulator